MNIPIDVAAVGVGKNKNCPLFGSRSNWNGTGGIIGSIDTGAEIQNEIVIKNKYTVFVLMKNQKNTMQ